MADEAIGVIQRIFDKETFNSGFEKRDAVIETEGQYPQPIIFSFLKDKSNLLDSYKVGDKVKISYNLRGRHHEPMDKYYNTLAAWKIERA